MPVQTSTPISMDNVATQSGVYQYNLGHYRTPFYFEINYSTSSPHGYMPVSGQTSLERCRGMYNANLRNSIDYTVGNYPCSEMHGETHSGTWYFNAPIRDYYYAMYYQGPYGYDTYLYNAEWNCSRSQAHMFPNEYISYLGYYDNRYTTGENIPMATFGNAHGGSGTEKVSMANMAGYVGGYWYYYDRFGIEMFGNQSFGGYWANVVPGQGTSIISWIASGSYGFGQWKSGGGTLYVGAYYMQYSVFSAVSTYTVISMFGSPWSHPNVQGTYSFNACIGKWSYYSYSTNLQLYPRQQLYKNTITSQGFGSNSYYNCTIEYRTNYQQLANFYTI